MIIAAALCPSPPVLVRELTGADPVVADLRDACANAVHALLAARPDVIVVVGPGPETTAWPAGSRLNIAAYGGSPAQPADVRAQAAPPASTLARPAGHAGRPAPARPAPARPGPVPLAVGLGGYLLDQAGYAGPRRLHSVSEDDQPATPAGRPRRGRDLSHWPLGSAATCLTRPGMRGPGGCTR